MKLFHSPSSPYVRKVLMVAHETGQGVERIACAAHPVNRDPKIVAVNPTGKVPTAVLDDGSALYDSRVITQWLDAQHGGAKMYPNGAARWPVLRTEAMADGLLDAALLVRHEVATRPEDYRWPDWADSHRAKIASSLDELEREAGAFSGVDAGLIAAACALSYLDFRFGDLDWRADHPVLAAWYDEFRERPSMKATELANPA